MDGQMAEQTDRRTDERTDGHTEGQTDCQMDEQMDGLTDGWTDGQTDRRKDKGFQGVRFVFSNSLSSDRFYIKNIFEISNYISFMMVTSERF